MYDWNRPKEREHHRMRWLRQLGDVTPLELHAATLIVGVYILHRAAYHLGRTEGFRSFPEWERYAISEAMATLCAKGSLLAAELEGKAEYFNEHTRATATE